MNASIRKLVEPLTGDNLRMFYKTIYKATPCGPMIGFRIDGEWVYGNDLPTEVGNAMVDGVSISSIVEGSDVEIEGQKFTNEFVTHAFWQAVVAVNHEAKFYWIRDNSTWIVIVGEEWCESLKTTIRRNLAALHCQAFDDKPKWDNQGGLTDKERQELDEFIRKHLDEIQNLKQGGKGLRVELGTKKTVFIQTWINDATY